MIFELKTMRSFFKDKRRLFSLRLKYENLFFRKKMSSNFAEQQIILKKNSEHIWRVIILNIWALNFITFIKKIYDTCGQDFRFFCFKYGFAIGNSKSLFFLFWNLRHGKTMRLSYQKDLIPVLSKMKIHGLLKRDLRREGNIEEEFSV